MRVMFDILLVHYTVYFIKQLERVYKKLFSQFNRKNA